MLKMSRKIIMHPSSYRLRYKFTHKKTKILDSLHAADKFLLTSFWSQDINRTYIRRSEGVLNVFYQVQFRSCDLKGLYATDINSWFCTYSTLRTHKKIHSLIMSSASLSEDMHNFVPEFLYHQDHCQEFQSWRVIVT